MIAGVDVILKLAGPRTKIIPGHGPVADRAALQTYRTMLDTVRARLRAAVADGKGLGDAIALKPTADFDATWGRGSIVPDDWVEMIYKGMLAHPER